ncbi:anti-sigma factor [Sphingomonas sp. RB3P16]|uniref:anti-sigma factor n=1 Tax=Parasphingomonas frigoris TaxID=3096163 RepID=UPI002FCAEC64
MSDLLPPDPLAGSGDAPDMTAGEFALGLLEGDERASAIRRVLADPRFAREVEAWRVHLAQLFDLWPAMPAPDGFARIEQALDATAPAGVTALPVRAPSKFWPGIAALSSIAAAALLVTLFVRPLSAPPTPAPQPTTLAQAPLPTLVASIAPTAKGTPVTAIYDAQAGAIRLTEAKLADAGRSAELWIIPAGGTPHSLGLLQTQGGTALTLTPANRARILAGATLAVSLEPLGGSPSGAPTGPVVAAGALSRV